MIINLKKNIDLIRMKKELLSLRLQESSDYRIVVNSTKDSIYIQFSNVRQANLWRVAVGYLYT